MIENQYRVGEQLWLRGRAVTFIERLPHAALGIRAAMELIGYDPETDTFPSTVFSGFSSAPLPYSWDVQGDDGTISMSVRAAGLELHRFLARGRTFSGGWRPNPGADETVNVPTT